MAYCSTCHRGSWACVCGKSFAERVRTVQVSHAGFDTRERKRYFDSDALDQQFGSHRKDRYGELLERTHGLGPLSRTKDGGSAYRHHKTGERKRAPDELVKRYYLGG